MCFSYSHLPNTRIDFDRILKRPISDNLSHLKTTCQQPTEFLKTDPEDMFDLTAQP